MWVPKSSSSARLEVAGDEFTFFHGRTQVRAVRFLLRVASENLVRLPYMAPNKICRCSPSPARGRALARAARNIGHRPGPMLGRAGAASWSASRRRARAHHPSLPSLAPARGPNAPPGHVCMTA